VTGRPDHLTDEAGAILTASIDERAYFVRSKRWIAYPKAVEILGHLNALLKHPRNDADAISRCLWRQRHGQVHAGRKVQGHLRGVRFVVRTISWISWSDVRSISRWRGSHRRKRPLAFSMPPFCHEA
jgi:hypothetical protein